MAFNRLPEEEKPENKAKLGLFDDFGQHKHNLDNSAHKDSVQSDLTCRVKDHVARGYTPRHTKLLCSTVFTATRVLELMKEPSVNSVNCARADSYWRLVWALRTQNALHNMLLCSRCSGAALQPCAHPGTCVCCFPV